MKALIAMSGGVDSSVAALLMTQKGYECVGCTMKLYDGVTELTPDSKTCCSLSDVEDARSIAQKLGMKYYVFNFQEDFQDRVILPFVNCYLEGKTPNPCIECNRHMKFAKLHERAKIMDCDVVVTGHYARVEKVGEEYFLKKGLDVTKDQSYVLYSMTQESLAHTCFPLGELTKQEIRRIAAENDFINADKPDSQDICFVPDGDYAKIVEQYAEEVPPTGAFVGVDGSYIGEHKGIIHYTIGQRKGLGIASTEPYYVCDIRPDTNEVVLGRSGDLFSTAAQVDAFHWISGHPATEPIRCKAKIRYRQVEQPATLYPQADGGAVLIFDEPQRAITKGQAAVVYDGDVVLGGGVITGSAENVKNC